jgi:protein arginine kinase
MKEKNKIKRHLMLKNPWASNDNAIWLASTVTLTRNLEKFKFPGKLANDRKNQIIALVENHISSSNLLVGPQVIRAEDISPIEKEFLIEHFLSTQNLHQARVGEAFIVDQAGESLISLNVTDHIQFQILESKGELEKSWNKIVKIETDLGKIIPYSFSTKFGFLTANPLNCGTGLNVTAFLQLSALIHTGKIDYLLEKYNDDSIFITGLQGSPTDIIGDLLAIQNNFSLGVTEETITSSLRAFIMKLLLEERKERSHLQKENNDAMKDKVSRAFGILSHSYQIDAVEALNAISLLKLGVDLGWIKGISIQASNELLFNCRRAHLLCQYPEEIPQEELLHKRAEFIHNALKETELLI